MASYDNIRIPWPGWHITGNLGEGGNGKVYKIERTQSGITEAAALKVISIPKSKTEYDAVRFTRDTDEEAEEYFTKKKESVLGEIKTMQDLKGCSNIVSIDDWKDLKKENSPGWDIYIRMEILTPFKVWFKTREATEDEVIKLGIDICNALVRCEKEDFIHRDIKPENILINKYGEYKLADFGIARELDHTTYVSRVGTPPYMSPEIYNGEEANRTVDLYSLGLVMYELLNDRRLPFVPKNYSMKNLQAAVQKRMDGEKIPAPVSGSPEIKRIVLKACAYDPKDRYRTAGEMKKALEKLQRQTEEAEETVSEHIDRSSNVHANNKSDGSKWSDQSETVCAETDPALKKRTADEPTHSSEVSPEHTKEPTDTTGIKKPLSKKQKKLLIIIMIFAMAVLIVIIMMITRGNDERKATDSDTQITEDIESEDTELTETVDFSSYIGEYRSEKYSIDYYDVLKINSVDGDAIDFYVKIYRYTVCAGTAIVDSPNSARFENADGAQGALSGTLEFGDDSITVRFDNSEYQYVSNLEYYFSITNETTSDSPAAESDENLSDVERKYLEYLSQQSIDQQWEEYYVIHYAVDDFIKNLNGEELLVYIAYSPESYKLWLVNWDGKSFRESWRYSQFGLNYKNYEYYDNGIAIEYYDNNEGANVLLLKGGLVNSDYIAKYDMSEGNSLYFKVKDTDVVERCIGLGSAGVNPIDEITVDEYEKEMEQMISGAKRMHPVFKIYQ